MPYIYHISFDIDQSDFGQLSVGKSLQNSLGYLRALLPGEPGYITSRAMYSLSDADKTHVIFESIWEDWADLEHHRNQSIFDENHLLNEFQLKAELHNMEANIYEEVA
jgi:hypothetical protein